jgi:hypothetical protein
VFPCVQNGILASQFTPIKGSSSGRRFRYTPPAPATPTPQPGDKLTAIVRLGCVIVMRHVRFIFYCGLFLFHYVLFLNNSLSLPLECDSFSSTGTL